jgi:hypothetical protein
LKATEGHDTGSVESWLVSSVDTSNPAIDRQVKTGHFLPATETRRFYFDGSSERKSVCTLVRQLRGPHLSTCA